jgi:3-hydroxyisobutyrate dehydrogenase
MVLDWCLDTDLKNIEQHCWQLLYEGVRSYKNPFHHGVISSFSDAFPSARTVIIREVDPDQKMIRFNTDIRSPKFAEISANPNICWLFYDEKLRMQMRCLAIANLHVNDPVAEKAWDEARLNCKITYTSPQAPGTPLNEPFLLDLNKEHVPDEELASARRNFSIVNTKVLSLDWTFLHHKGNRRAWFDYRKNMQTWMQS